MLDVRNVMAFSPLSSEIGNLIESIFRLPKKHFSALSLFGLYNNHIEDKGPKLRSSAQNVSIVNRC